MMVAQGPGEIVDVGIDWVTLSGPPVGDDYEQRSADARGIIRGEWGGGLAGFENKKVNVMGYAGLQFGPLFWGHRPDGQLIRVSGAAARLVRRMWLGPGWRCTRIDAQVTGRAERSPDSRIAAAVGQAIAAARGKEGRPAAVRHIMGFGQGDTLTIGSRRSPKYARVYNKEIESGFEPEYKGCVRWELEIKNSIAEKVYNSWLDARDPDEFVHSIVGSFFSELGCAEPGEPNLDVAGLLKHHAKEDDVERQLRWLESSVQTVVRKLLSQGMRRDVLQALGLDEGSELDITTLKMF